jgi:hypothetical protein
VRRGQHERKQAPRVSKVGQTYRQAKRKRRAECDNLARADVYTEYSWDDKGRGDRCESTGHERATVRA